MDPLLICRVNKIPRPVVHAMMPSSSHLTQSRRLCFTSHTMSTLLSYTCFSLLASTTAYVLPQAPQRISTLHRGTAPAARFSSAAFVSTPPSHSFPTRRTSFSRTTTSSSATRMTSSAKYDVVVYGATSFAGQRVCEYYLTNYGASPPTFKWALAAR